MIAIALLLVAAVVLTIRGEREPEPVLVCRIVTAILLALGAVAAGAYDARAQDGVEPVGKVVCGERAALLGARPGQRRLWVAIESTGVLVEYFVDRAGRWSELGTDRTGYTCVLAEGDGFEVDGPPIMLLGERVS